MHEIFTSHLSTCIFYPCLNFEWIRLAHPSCWEHTFKHAQHPFFIAAGWLVAFDYFSGNYLGLVFWNVAPVSSIVMGKDFLAKWNHGTSVGMFATMTQLLTNFSEETWQEYLWHFYCLVCLPRQVSVSWWRSSWDWAYRPEFILRVKPDLKKCWIPIMYIRVPVGLQMQLNSNFHHSQLVLLIVRDNGNWRPTAIEVHNPPFLMYLMGYQFYEQKRYIVETC